MPADPLQSLLEQSLPADALLYHYTKATGLLGIVNGRTMWATDLRYQNDGLELKLALDLIEEIAAELEPTFLNVDRDLSRTATNPIDFTMEQARVAHVYVASFTEEPDVLSQWLGYGGSGNGYALGFSPDSLARIHLPPI